VLPAPGRIDQPAGDTVEVPGDHFTMMEDNASLTARAVEDWLTRKAEGLSPVPQVSNHRPFG
jgi:hypothetical protein